MERAAKGDYRFAAKLVRGAYVPLEREYAAENNLEDPIWPTMQETHTNYNTGVVEVLNKIASGAKVEIMVASHNQGSVELAIKTMRDLELTVDSGVYFGQLLGMSDNLTFPLGQAGYKAYKYVGLKFTLSLSSRSSLKQFIPGRFRTARSTKSCPI
jgi:proline dehydrogenase